MNTETPSRPLLPALLLASLYLAPLPGHALQSDREQPIDLEADSAEIDDKRGVSIYTGHVEITQGSMHIRADKLVVEQHRGKGTRLIATGRPMHFRQLPAPGKPPVRGHALRAEYDTGSELLILSGNAVLQQGKDRFANDRIVYDRVKGVVRAGRSAKGKTRVRITIDPNPSR